MANISIDNQQKAELVAAVEKVARENNWNPSDVLTIMSFETAGSLDPWQAGPTTKWGQHRGLIQWGEPQARQYGVSKNTSIAKQVEAAAQFMKDNGVKPGDGILPMYASINAGDAKKINASDAKAGGTWGTVADKVNHQMGAHQTAARSLISGYGRNPYASNPVPAAAPMPTIDNSPLNWQTSFDQFGGKATTPQFAPSIRNGMPSAYAEYAASRSQNAQPTPSAPVPTSRENLGADRINRSAYSEYGSSRMAAPISPANVAPVSVPNVHSNFDSAGRFTGQSKPAASSLPSDMAAQYASYRPGTVQSKPATAVTSKAIAPKDAYTQYAASMAAAPGRNLTSLAAALPDDPVPVAAKKTTLDEQLAEEERISRPKVAKDLARVERFNPNRKSVANVLTNAVVRTPAYQLFAALTGKPTDAKAGGLLGSLMGGLSGVAGGLGAPIGSNYSGGWTPAAGGNQVSASPIGVGIGGESLRGVQNQYGATSMLGEGGSRTYGGPGGSSGK